MVLFLLTVILIYKIRELSLVSDFEMGQTKELSFGADGSNSKFAFCLITLMLTHPFHIHFLTSTNPFTIHKHPWGPAG